MVEKMRPRGLMAWAPLPSTIAASPVSPVTTMSSWASLSTIAKSAASLPAPTCTDSTPRRCVCRPNPRYSQRMTTLYIDAHACPVTRDAISTARSHDIPVMLVSNESQDLGRHTQRRGVESVQVGAGRDAADFAIVERLAQEDIVVTGDTGLAAMVLGKGAQAISPRGRIFSTITIDAELALRRAEQLHRRTGGRTRGPSPFESEDREHFRESLQSLLCEQP